MFLFLKPSLTIEILRELKDVAYYHKRILDFLISLVPKALLITDFNGNFVFQVNY